MNATTPRERVVAAIAVSLPVLFIGWLHWAAASAWLDARELAASGQRVSAVVTDVDGSSGPRSETYRISYRYEWQRSDATRTFESTEQVDRATFDAVRRGDRLAIRVDPDDPSRSAIARNDRVATLLFIVVVVDLMVLAAGVLIARSAGRATRSP